MPGIFDELDAIRVPLPREEGIVGDTLGRIVHDKGGIVGGGEGTATDTQQVGFNRIKSKRTGKIHGKDAFGPLADKKEEDHAYYDGYVGITWMMKAHAAGGCALPVLLLLLREARVKRSLRVQLPGKLRRKLEAFGLRRPAVKRAYAALAAKQMIKVEPPEREGLRPWITLLVDQWPVTEAPIRGTWEGESDW